MVEQRKTGFTLVELLVVITIIGILIALLLPAVQAAREAARRMQCSNNLKQIGLALHNYHTAMRRFPPGVISTSGNVWARAESGRHGTSWLLCILPYVEQSSLYDKWDFTKNVVGNMAVARTDIGAFYCPSRRNSVREKDVAIMFQQWDAGGTDYGGCFGASNYFNDCLWSAGCPNASCSISHTLAPNVTGTYPDEVGIFGFNDSAKIADIFDGTSQTLMTGEVQRLHGGRDHNDDGIACNEVSADGWAAGGLANLFDTAFDGTYNPGGLNNWYFESPGGEHPGGANCGLADGSIRFISENIDTTLFKRLGSRAGGEIVVLP